MEGVNHLEDVVGEGAVGGADAVDREEDVADSGDDVGGGGELRGGEEEEEVVEEGGERRAWGRGSG